MSQDGSPSNRLAAESSPYLLLHRHNPVDWYPWGPEALERARREDKPIFLSVGYSTCYWCHVMERESFSSPRVAELMNREFVNVKLDREERPDLDEVYMTATQILAGQGGWPNSVFLTPALTPFFAGTYFPPEDRHGRAGFPTVLRSLAGAWRERRDEVEAQAESVSQAMRQYLEERALPSPHVPGPEVAQRSWEGLASRFDEAFGGFGGAPKFPSPANLLLLLELAPEEPRAAAMLAATLDRMGRGGIYDQLAGGFHRYATDREWKVPHFEKMLYDNGLLLEVYARFAVATGDGEAARVARETAAFLVTEMRSAEGAFWSAIDAETQGREGAYHVWSRDQLKEVLGEEDFGFAAPLLGFDGAPFFEGEHYVLHLPVALPEAARRRRLPHAQLVAELAPIRARLLAARDRRPRPLTDDKVLADWNGMAIAGLATAGGLLGEPDLVRQAATAARFVLDTMRPEGGPLRHAWRAGRASVPAFLADYVFVVHGLLALHRATGEAGWLTAAAELADEQSRRLGDPRGGYFVAAESADLLFRSKELFDGALPGANGMAALNLVELARRTGAARWATEAERTLLAFGLVVERMPEPARTMALAVRRFHAAGLARPATAGPSPGTGGEPPWVAEARGKVTAEAFVADADDEGWRPLRIELTIAPGWHVNAHDTVTAGLVATELSAEGFELRDLVYPRGVKLEGAEPGSPAVYRDHTVIRGELRGLTGSPGRLLVALQPCTEDRCLSAVTVEALLRMAS